MAYDIKEEQERKRNERKLFLDARQFAAATENPKLARPINQKRIDELTRATATKLDPATTPRPAPAASPGNIYAEIEFNVWKEGVMGTMKLAVSQDFEPLE